MQHQQKKTRFNPSKGPASKSSHLGHLGLLSPSILCIEAFQHKIDCYQLNKALLYSTKAYCNGMTSKSHQNKLKTTLQKSHSKDHEMKKNFTRKKKKKKKKKLRRT